MEYFSNVSDHADADADDYKGVAAVRSRREYDAAVAGDKPTVVGG
jgi:hypothetical protein